MSAIGHDRKCPWRPPLWGQGGTGPVVAYPCVCTFIAKVRADERSRCLDAVAGAEHYRGCNSIEPDPTWQVGPPYACDCPLADAIDAITSLPPDTTRGPSPDSRRAREGDDDGQ